MCASALRGRSHHVPQGGAGGKVTLRGAYEYVKAQSHRSHDVITNLLKPLQFKLKHYPYPDPTVAPDLRACPQIMYFKKASKMREAKAAYEGREDRQKGIDKGYTKQEMAKAGQYLWDKCSKESISKGTSVLTPYMARVNWTWSLATMGRSQDLRDRECPDLHTYVHEGLFPHGDAAVVTACLTTDAKHNSARRKEYVGALRHKDATICTTGALACYVVCR
ncbi:hypothetical protein EBR96_10920 [bacterium]|nr:hypothetical protein [bacterium]